MLVLNSSKTSCQVRSMTEGVEDHLVRRRQTCSQQNVQVCAIKWNNSEIFTRLTMAPFIGWEGLDSWQHWWETEIPPSLLRWFKRSVLKPPNRKITRKFNIKWLAGYSNPGPPTSSPGLLPHLPPPGDGHPGHLHHLPGHSHSVLAVHYFNLI